MPRPYSNVHGRYVQASVHARDARAPMHAHNCPHRARPLSHYGRLPPSPRGRELARPACGHLLTISTRTLRASVGVTCGARDTYACTQLSSAVGGIDASSGGSRLLEPATTVGVAVYARTSVRAYTRSFAAHVAVCVRTCVRTHTRSFRTDTEAPPPLEPDCLPGVRTAAGSRPPARGGGASARADARARRRRTHSGRPEAARRASRRAREPGGPCRGLLGPVRRRASVA